jgi:hypothetical protein
MTTLTFRVTADEAGRIRRLARRERLTVSEFLRRCVAVAPSGLPPRLRRVNCPLTGATIFAGISGQPPLTTEMVRNLMADFP